MDWFSETEYPFAMFSPQHLFPLAVIALLVLLLYRFKKSLRLNVSKQIIRFGLSAILILFELLLYGWYFYHEQFAWDYSLPLQLCSISYLLTILMLLFPSYRLYEFLYFAGIGGAVQALLTPAAILSGFPHFTYFYFFVGHGAIVWVALYMTWVHGYRPTWHSIWRVLLMMNGLLAVIIPINWITGGNYLFVAEKPAGDTLLNYLGPWPWYLLSLEAVMVVIFILMYLPFHFGKSSKSE
ncbi:YwaF family protein [Paenibacillus sedimenti]|uniref:TIGR02206 family membrane protein n=1 Tax=Paenibacillus sedimenti TaxID=2770274 RepID=A0A926KX61_9BACL|nr:TIGR02206 family membrane protein [Paenibacillus sedimenti]MBD0383789.1 TIGR02206 family membrane protein [Paenibacillus sedimenti]